MSKSKIFVFHFLAFISFSLFHFFSSEFLVKFFLPGFHNVGIWLSLVIGGIILIFMITTISFITFSVIRKRIV